MNLFWKIFSAVLITFVVISLGLTYFVIYLQISQAEKYIFDLNKTIGNVISKEIEQNYAESRWPFEILAELSKRKDFLFWWIVDNEGGIYLANAAPFIRTNAYHYFPRIKAEKLFERDIFLSPKQNYGIFLKRLELGPGKKDWSFWLGFSLKETFLKKKKDIAISVLMFSALLLILLGLAIYFIVRYFLKPITVLIASTEIIAKGYLTHRVNIKSRDEFGRLAASFNKMTEELQNTATSIANLNREIVERKNAEEALRQSENYLKIVFNSVAVGIMLVDAETHQIVDVNPVIIKAFGADKDKIVGSLCHQYICPAEKGKCPISDLGQTVDNSERVMIKANGEKIPVLKTVTPLILNNRKLFLESFVDITKRKKAEEELQLSYTKLQETQEQLIQAEKLNAVGQLASGVAHEVKNPLGIILQGINYLEKKPVLGGEDISEILDTMKNNIKRADDIIRALVDFSRASELRRNPEDINSILESSLNLVEHNVRIADIKIVKELKKDLPNVSVDKGKMEQVFVNLFLNAIQAMPQGGTLSIRAHMTKLSKLGNGTGRRNGDSFKVGEKVIVIEIEDTGMGIPEENIKRVFDPFFTTKGPRDGAGLGLSVTRNIIEMHKGLIEIESEAGKGTKVIITLKITGEK